MQSSRHSLKGQHWRRPVSEYRTDQAFDGVIFLPGLLCDEQLFAPQRAALQGLYPVEIPNLGGQDSFEAMAEHVLAQTRFERFALAGLSMGGALAMNMARWAPHRVERLGILDANPRADDDRRRDNRRRQIADATRIGVGELTRRELAQLYLAPDNQTPDFIQIAVSMAEGHGLEVYKRQQNALMTRQSSIQHLPDYRGETLVLCGDLDILCLPEWHVEMAEIIPNSSLTIIPGAGHLATVEAPEQSNAAILDWLKR